MMKVPDCNKALLDTLKAKLPAGINPVWFIMDTLSIGKEPSAGQKLDISGDTHIDDGLTVEGATSLKDAEIVGTSSVQPHLVCPR